MRFKFQRMNGFGGMRNRSWILIFLAVIATTVYFVIDSREEQSGLGVDGKKPAINQEGRVTPDRAAPINKDLAQSANPSTTKTTVAKAELNEEPKKFARIFGVVVDNRMEPFVSGQVILRQLEEGANGVTSRTIEEERKTGADGGFELITRVLGEKRLHLQVKKEGATFQNQIPINLVKFEDVDLGQIEMPKSDGLKVTLRILDTVDLPIQNAWVSLIPYDSKYTSVSLFTDSNGRCSVAGWGEDVELLIDVSDDKGKVLSSARLLSRQRNWATEENYPDGSIIVGSQRVYYHEGKEVSLVIREPEPIAKKLIHELTIERPPEHPANSAYTYTLFEYQPNGLLRSHSSSWTCALPTALKLSGDLNFFLKVGMLTNDQTLDKNLIRETTFSLHDNVKLSMDEKIMPRFKRGYKVQGIIKRGDAPSEGRLVSARLHPSLKMGDTMRKTTNAKGEFVLFLPQNGPEEFIAVGSSTHAKAIKVDKTKSFNDPFGDRTVDIGILEDW